MDSIKILFIFCFQTFKAEIEKPEQPGGPLLDPTDVKLICGKVPPIYEVHKKLRDELAEKCARWREESCIGDVLVKHVRTHETSS